MTVNEKPAVSGNEVYYVITDGPKRVGAGKEAAFTAKQILGLDNALRLSDERHNGRLFLAIEDFLKNGNHLGETFTFSFKPFSRSQFNWNEKGLILSHPVYEVFYLPSRKQGFLTHIG